jgi:peptidoglycan/xylan/chitin deacetylase (PgdA/CDA1 family)
VTSAMRRNDEHRVAAGTPRPGAPWDALAAELDVWAAAGRTATLWWRDDDADAASPALERLLALQRQTGAPLALAVVPQRLDPSLARLLADCDGVSVLQHGYSHDNFAAPGERKIELDGSRPGPYVIADLATGQQALDALPGWLPVLAPPWNRIAPYLIPMLPELGYRGISTLGARDRRCPVAGLACNNVHIDPIDWRGRTGPAGGFAGEEAALAALTAHLADRREGRADADEASGLMTHHRVQDPATWDFVRQLIAETTAHPAARWCTAEELFAP